MTRPAAGTSEGHQRPFWAKLPGLRHLRDALYVMADMHRELGRLDAKLWFLSAIRADERKEAALRQQARYQDPRHLVHFEWQSFSQNGEDGIIAEIFRRIGVSSRYFVEFGVGDGLENNTSLLLAQGWKGLWIEGDPDSAKKIENGLRPLIDTGALRFLQRFVTAEGIEQVFAEAGVPSEFDLLSIDIDGNDYWVWNAIRQFRPRVVIIEYNAIFPPATEWVCAYRSERVWDGSGDHGASLRSLEMLGLAKGYRLVSCCFEGVNAFFVRSDLVGDQFAPRFDAEYHQEPPRYGLPRRPGHPRSYPMIYARVTNDRYLTQAAEPRSVGNEGQG